MVRRAATAGGRSRQSVSAISATATLSGTADYEVPPGKRTRFVHRQCSALQFSSIELRDRFFSSVVAHLHKSESPGPAGVAVRDNADRFDLSGLRKQGREVIFRRLKRQISYI
jgi:hypothetical protein